MAITPQAIKDQEFQVKFRGYDPVEVKAYLELIAEEFFELLEQIRQQIDEMDVIVDERDTLRTEKATLQEELASVTGSSEEILSEVQERGSEVATLRDEIDRLKKVIARLEEEKESRELQIATAKDEIQQRDERVQQEKERSEKLIDKVDQLMKQNEELRKEELDFKSTLVAAQQFTNEIKRKSEEEAREIVRKARAEVDKLRQDTYDELARYPAEIERLKNKRNQVREDLEATLKLCLENLEIFQDDVKAEDENSSELFQSIKLQNLQEGETDELDDISMAFDLPGTDDSAEEETFSMKEEMKNLGGDFS